MTEQPCSGDTIHRRTNLRTHHEHLRMLIGDLPNRLPQRTWGRWSDRRPRRGSQPGGVGHQMPCRERSRMLHPLAGPHQAPMVIQNPRPSHDQSCSLTTSRHRATPVPEKTKRVQECPKKCKNNQKKPISGCPPPLVSWGRLGGD